MLSVAPALALLVASAVAHPLTANVARHRAIARTNTVGWDGVQGYDLESDQGYLEPYETYNARYTAIGCTGKHGTPFFESCCHPLLATETLAEHRPAECNAPASAPVEAAPAPAPTEPVLITAPEEEDDEDLEDCEEDEEVEGSAPVSEAPAASPSPSPAPAPTTTAKAEETSSSAVEASPSPEPSPEPATSSSQAATEPTPSPEPPKDEGNNNGGSGETFSGGRVTWYEQNGNPGHCGEFHADSDLIAAMNTKQFFDLDVCGKNIELKGNGNSVVVKVVDSCPGCHENSVDLSVGAFKALGGLDLGVIDVTWKFV